MGDIESSHHHKSQVPDTSFLSSLSDELISASRNAGVSGTKGHPVVDHARELHAHAIGRPPEVATGIRHTPAVERSLSVEHTSTAGQSTNVRQGHVGGYPRSPSPTAHLAGGGTHINDAGPSRISTAGVGSSHIRTLEAVKTSYASSGSPQRDIETAQPRAGRAGQVGRTPEPPGSESRSYVFREPLRSNSFEASRGLSDGGKDPAEGKILNTPAIISYRADRNPISTANPHQALPTVLQVVSSNQTLITQNGFVPASEPRQFAPQVARKVGDSSNMPVVGSDARFVVSGISRERLPATSSSYSYAFVPKGTGGQIADEVPVSKVPTPVPPIPTANSTAVIAYPAGRLQDLSGSIKSYYAGPPDVEVTRGIPSAGGVNGVSAINHINTRMDIKSFAVDGKVTNFGTIPTGRNFLPGIPGTLPPAPGSLGVFKGDVGDINPTGVRIGPDNPNHTIDKRYVLGTEIAIAAITAAAGASRRRVDSCVSEPTVGSLHRAGNPYLPNKTEDDTRNTQAKPPAISWRPLTMYKIPERKRPTMLVSKQDNLVDIAEKRFDDPNLGWLIADLNRAVCNRVELDSKYIVEFESRQEIVLPVWDDIVEFYENNKGPFDNRLLITIVKHSTVDQELLESTLGSVMKTL